MATLEKVMQMQTQGMSDVQIINILKNEGVSPREIDDTMAQARVKGAVDSPASPIPVPNPNQNPDANLPPPGMQASMGAPPTNPQMPAQAQVVPQDVPTVPPGPQVYPQEPLYDQAAYQEDYYQPTPNAYSDQEGYGDYYGGGNLDTGTISEIAEQVASEKLNEFKKQTGDLRSFQNLVSDKLTDLDSRLKRIEDTIAKLQSAVIDRVGEFGQNSALIHKDLENLHGTVSKLMDPLVDNYEELRKLNEK